MEIQELAKGRGEEAWDRFVRMSPDGTFFHLTTWRRVVSGVFQHTPHYLKAVRGGEIQGVLPLFEIRGLLSGHVLVSVPYGVYGGLCGTDPDARAALLEEARKLAERKGIRHVEFRHLRQSVPELPTKSLYSTFAKPLDADPETNLSNIPRKQRRMIRQGIKKGLVGRLGWENLPEFYRIYAVNRRHLGSPPFPAGLFEAVRDNYDGSEAQLLTIWHQDRMVAGVISFFYKSQVMPYYGAALPEAFSLAANDFMYWELMRASCVQGCRIFDFGRSRQGSGSSSYKRHWGFEPEPLAYQYLLVKGRRIPEMNPSNGRLRMLIGAWRRLPLPVTKWVGPGLTKWLPLD